MEFELIEELEKMADEVELKNDFIEAARYYKSIIDIIEGTGDLERLANYYDLYGVSLGKAGQYEKALGALNKSYWMMYKLNGGIESKWTVSSLKSMYEYAAKAELDGIDINSHNYLERLFKGCGEIGDIEELKEHSEYMDEILDNIEGFVWVDGEKTCEIPKYTYVSETFKIWNTTEPPYNEWFKDLSLVCEYFKVLKDIAGIGNLVQRYFTRWEKLLCEVKEETRTILKDLIYDYFNSGLFNLGKTMYDLELYEEACSLFERALGNFGYNSNWWLCFLHYIYACAMSKINRAKDGEKLLLKDLEQIKASKYEIDNSKISDLSNMYWFLGSYYEYHIKDNKKAIQSYKKSFEIEKDSVSLKHLIKLLQELGNISEAKAYCMLGLNAEHHRYCMETLAEIHKDDLNYTESAKLYKALLETEDDPYEREQYRREMYWGLAYTEVDSQDILDELERYFERKNVLRAQASLETIKDINAMATAYISYGMYCLNEKPAAAIEYIEKGNNMYKQFFEMSETLMEEAIQEKSRKELLPYVKEYDAALQRYLELIDFNNVEELYDLVVKYQAFLYEVDRIIEGDNGGRFSNLNVSYSISDALQGREVVLNYVNFYERDIRKLGVFIIDKSSIKFKTLGRVAAMESRIHTFKEELISPTPNASKFERERTALKEVLIGSAADGFKKAYVIRTKGLEGIPFHLLTGMNTIELMNANDLLIKGPENTYNKYENVIVFSDPKFEIDGYETISDRYSELHGSKLEGMAINDIYGEQAFLFVESKANVKNFIAAVRDDSCDVLHISSHSIKEYNEVDGFMESAKLLLAGANNMCDDTIFQKTYGKRGMISAAEISKLKMRKNRLVFLAACTTGLSDVVEGAGGYGLSRAFYQHGNTVISTLFPIADYPSMVFCKIFYEKLKDCNEPETALNWTRNVIPNLSKKELIKIIKKLPDIERGKDSRKKYIKELKMMSENPYKAPYYWAGFIIGK